MFVCLTVNLFVYIDICSFAYYRYCHFYNKFLTVKFYLFLFPGEKMTKSALKKLRKDWEKQKKIFDSSSAAN